MTVKPFCKIGSRTRMVSIGLTLVAVLMMGGCAEVSVKNPESSKGDAARSSDPAAEKALALASYYYDEGNYPAVIGLLTANRDWLQASVPLQIRARKLLAFSHCINGQATVCEWYFDAILELDPKFELTPFESGHPAWDPVFRRAKRAFDKRKGG